MEKSMEWKVFDCDLRIFLSLAVLVCTFWLLKFFSKKLQFFKKASTIPSCKTGPFGALGDMAGKSVNECFQKVLQYFQESPEIAKVWFGSYMLVGVTKPEYLEVFMNCTDCLDKGPLLEFAKSYFGDGLVTASANIWKRNRKLINPAFNQKVLNSFIPNFADICDIMIGLLEKHVGQDIDIKDYLSRCTLDTICETTMGTTVKAQTTDNCYGKSLETFLEILMVRWRNIFFHSQIIFEMTKTGKLWWKMVTEMNDFSKKVITEQRAVFEGNLRGDYIEGDDSQTKTLLELLFEISYKGDHFTDKQLQDEVNTFIAAGTDTTAVAISFCCLTLGMHPEYQQKVYEEAIEILGADRYATKEDLPKLKFTEMFIKETLRVFPVTPFLIRIATDDIRVDDMVIPKDALIVFGVLSSHRNPKYWENPLEFNPNRFLPEEWAKKHPYSHIPFSAGLRSCIGLRYAMMLMKLILSKMVRKFRIKTDYKCVEEVELTINLLTSPSRGFKITLEPRD